MGSGKTNKTRGHNGERYYANFFRALGFTFCETSRQASRKHDNAKIDLMYIPYNIQIKTGKHSTMNPGKELFSMETSINVMFPPENEVFKKPCILIHRKMAEGYRRTDLDDLVYMSLQQFNLFNNNGAKLEYISLKEFKFDLFSQFKTIVCITVENFKNNIILKEHPNVNNSNEATDSGI
jgi:hypothetical protein